MNEKRYSLCGIDPGKITGFFTVTVTLKHDDEPLSCTRPYWRQLSRDEVSDAVELQLSREPDTIFAVERYVITRRTARLSQQTDALEVIGLVREIARRHDSRLFEQNKSDAVKLASNIELKRMGWYRPGMRHANDGARHALYALSGIAHVAFTRAWENGTIIS